ISSLKRRLNRICLVDKFASFAELRYKVISDKSYLQRFVEEITVNVTEMFRDPLFYKKLRNDILPKLGTYPFIRIWVAGCSTGERAYSRSEEHTSELQSRENLVCRLLLEKKKKKR